MNAAIALLKECALLKIDDLLPWFPDFVVIDRFKDKIVESLEDYNARIDELKEEMDHYTSSAEQVRVEIRGLKTRPRRAARRPSLRALRPGHSQPRLLPLPLLPCLPRRLSRRRGRCCSLAPL